MHVRGQLAWGFRKAVAQELGDWGREREEVWRGRDRETRSRLEKAVKILQRLEGASRRTRSDGAADSGSDTACSAAATVLGAVEAGERPGKQAKKFAFVFGASRVDRQGGVQQPFVVPPMRYCFV